MPLPQGLGQINVAKIEIIPETSKYFFIKKRIVTKKVTILQRKYYHLQVRGKRKLKQAELAKVVKIYPSFKNQEISVNLSARGCNVLTDKRLRADR